MWKTERWGCCMLMLIAEMNAVAVVVVTTSFYRMNDLKKKI